MTIGLGDWLRETRAIYLDNATSVRDYRVQLRGNRSVILFGTYLFVLISVAMLVYAQTAHNAPVEVVEAQRELKTFYAVVMGLMGGLVSLVAPALTATTVVTERLRRSLDLVFSAPVSPRYFLVGKMMSSFRYTWMLLILSLPITSTCVVLGGASWQDVLVAYTLLSFIGLILTSIALLLSTFATKPIGAIISSYGASIAYLLFTGVIAGPSLFVSHSTNELPFLSALNPFLVQQAATTFSEIGPYKIPNWIAVGILACLISKICLLGAGVLLSPTPQREIRKLRIHALTYIFLLAVYVSSMAAMSGPLSIGPTNSGKALFISMLPLVVVLPFLGTFGVEAERRYWPDGAFSFRKFFSGSPATGLPFIFAMILASAVGIQLGLWFGTRTLLSIQFASWIFFTATFWAFFWSIGRFGSSSLAGLRPARTLQFSAFVAVVVIPVPFLSAVSAVTYTIGSDDSPWRVYVLRPLFIDAPASDTSALQWGFGLAVASLAIAYLAEVRTMNRMAGRKVVIDD